MPKICHYLLREILKTLKSITTNCVIGCSSQMNSDYTWLGEADITDGSIFLLQLSNFYCNWRVILVKKTRPGLWTFLWYHWTYQGHPWGHSSFKNWKGLMEGTLALLQSNYPGTFIRSHYEYLISERILQKRLNLIISLIIIMYRVFLCCNSSVGLQKIIR